FGNSYPDRTRLATSPSDRLCQPAGRPRPRSMWAPDATVAMVERKAMVATVLHGSRMPTRQPLVADVDPQRVKEDHRIDRVERPDLPFPHLLEHGVGDPADQVVV